MLRERLCTTVVQPPDEYAVNVSNSAFTNMIAARSLRFAAKLAQMCNLPKRAGTYSDYAKQVYIPFDATVNYHPEYDDYVIGTISFVLSFVCLEGSLLTYLQYHFAMLVAFYYCDIHHSFSLM